MKIHLSTANVIKALVFVAGGGLAGLATSLSTAFPTESSKISAYAGLVIVIAGAVLHVVSPSEQASK